MDFKLLIHGIDTLVCAYYMKPHGGPIIDFEVLGTVKESIRQSKDKSPVLLDIDGDFLLHPFGSPSGYPFILENELFKVQLGEFNYPNFYVTFKSQALWHSSVMDLHEEFLDLAYSFGFILDQPEALSRVDFCFDYYLPEIDFSEESFVSRSSKNAQYREGKKIQTFSFGRGDIVLRIYDKIEEIKQQSQKTWFFPLWGRETDVWRIEWQVRKQILKKHDIRTFEDLDDQQGDLLRYLSSEHDTLRIPSNDSNPSRWPIHPLWKDLQEQIAELSCLGVYRAVDRPALLEERMERIAISVLGYLKSVAAVRCLQINNNNMDLDKALDYLTFKMRQHHEPIAWQAEVEKRINKYKFGQ